MKKYVLLIIACLCTVILFAKEESGAPGKSVNEPAKFVCKCARCKNPVTTKDTYCQKPCKVLCSETHTAGETRTTCESHCRHCFCCDDSITNNTGHCAKCEAEHGEGTPDCTRFKCDCCGFVCKFDEDMQGATTACPNCTGLYFCKQGGVKCADHCGHEDCKKQGSTE